MMGPLAAATVVLWTVGWSQGLPASLLAAMPAMPAAGLPKIVDRPISFSEKRKELTIEYRRIHQDPAIDDINIEPKMVVLHYTAGGSGEATWRYFNRTYLEEARDKLRRAGAVNVSSHFLVERDGTIYRLLPETWMGRHCIGLNHVAVGVENVGDGDKYPLTQAQVEANAALIRYLAREHGITHVIGHHESPAMEGHPYFLELDPNYRNIKSDPGEAFMSQVRARIADLGLQGPPPRP